MATQKILIPSVTCTEIVIALVCLLFLLCFLRMKGHPWNWPLIGMLPTVWFPISRNVFDNLTHILECTKGTFVYKGPWFFSQSMIITSDPANFQHILGTKFSNYPKGADAKILFEAYGAFLFSLDFDEWRSHRKITHAFINDQRMYSSTPKINLEIFVKGLIPVLDHACEKGLVLDLKDVSRRFSLDVTIMSVTGFNHCSLRKEFPDDPLLEAIKDINHGIFMRTILTEKIWKLQRRWLVIGQEKKILKASKIMEDLVSEYIRRKKEEGVSKETEEKMSAFSFFSSSDDDMIREFIRASLFASVDTTSAALNWFFWLVQENPIVESKIREEIEAKLSVSKFKKLLFVNPEELNKLVFLHAALLESLRLYPSAPLQMRTCFQSDILPSGHHVKSGTKVMLVPYAVGKMKSIWGEDCRQFKPERWISEKGRIIPIPSHKFVAFSSGPRICSGKELALLRMKSVAATIIHNYDIQLLKNCPITPSTEVILDMKYGLHATVRKRSA